MVDLLAHVARHQRPGVAVAPADAGPWAEAGDGEEALRLIGEVRPDVVLLDVRMPKLDGLGVLRALQFDPDDGAVNMALGAIGALFRILFPLSAPGIVASIVLAYGEDELGLTKNTMLTGVIIAAAIGCTCPPVIGWIFAK